MGFPARFTVDRRHTGVTGRHPSPPYSPSPPGSYRCHPPVSPPGFRPARLPPPASPWAAAPAPAPSSRHPHSPPPPPHSPPSVERWDPHRAPPAWRGDGGRGRPRMSRPPGRSGSPGCGMAGWGPGAAQRGPGRAPLHAPALLRPAGEGEASAKKGCARPPGRLASACAGCPAFRPAASLASCAVAPLPPEDPVLGSLIEAASHWAAPGSHRPRPRRPRTQRRARTLCLPFRTSGGGR